MMQSSSEVLSAPVSVCLLAENRFLRETLPRLLAKRGGLSIVDVSPYTESTVEKIFSSGCAILLMDSLATKQGTTLLADLSERASGIGVILFGMDDEIDLFVRFAHLGVSGYVLQEASASEIIAAVLAVARGETAWPPHLCIALGHHPVPRVPRPARFSMLAGGVKCQVFSDPADGTDTAGGKRVDQKGNRSPVEPLKLHGDESPSPHHERSGWRRPP